MRRCRSGLPALAAAALVATVGSPALAQKVTFEPSIELGQGYTDNVGFAAIDTRSDDITTLRLVLPVLREWRTGRLDFRYEPAFSRYNQFDSLDRDEHNLRFGVRSEPKRGTSYRLATRYRNTQAQGDPESSDDADLFLARRTDRQIATADFTTSTRLGPRWIWEWGLGGTLYDFTVIDGFEDSSIADNPVEDRTEARSTVRFARELRSAASLGFQLAYSEFDLDVSPDADMSAVRLVYNRRLGRHADIGLSVGAYELDSELDSQDKTGVDLNASLTRRFRKVVLGLSGRSAPSSGGALRGASTNTLIALSLSNLDAAKWSWRISPRVAERDPNDPSLGERRTVAIGAEVGRRIAQQLRIRLRANRVDQSDDTPGSEDRETLTAEFALQWFPRGGA